MDNKENIQIIEDKEDKKPVNEHGGFYFSSMVKIYDPNSEEILVQVRGDN
jgi:hypothetical protein